MLTKRNPNYWKEGRAHFDEVEILGIADVVSRTNALKTGQIDVMNRCDLKTTHLLDDIPGLQIISIAGGYHITIPMLVDRYPHDNNDVRLALKYAIDREHLVKAILQGHGRVGNDNPIAPFQRFFASELPQRKYDPDKARYHMKKAGLEGYTFKLHTAETACMGAVDIAVLYKEHAAKAGITIDVVREPNDGYWSDVWNKKPWCFSYWSGSASEDWMFTTAYSEGSSSMETNWKHKRFNELLKSARSELDKAKRREMYVEMQRIVRDEGGAVIPIFVNHVDASTTKVKFKNRAKNFGLDGLRGAERWWFEA